MIGGRFIQRAAGTHGIRRGGSLANSAGTYEFAREHPATSCAPAAGRAGRAIRRPAPCERANPVAGLSERAGVPGAVSAGSRVRRSLMAREVRS